MNKIEAKVFPEAIQTAKDLVATGSFCRQTEAVSSKTSLSLLRLRQIFPYIGPCVVDWATRHQRETINKVDILSALAGDFHLGLTKQEKKLYQMAYIFDDFDEFCLFHLVNTGRLTEKNQLFDETSQITFSLQPNQPLAKNHGQFAAIHLGQIICLISKQEAKQIQAVQQAEPMTKKLLHHFAGKTVHIFSERRR